MNTIDDAVDGWQVRLAHFRAPSQRSDLGQTTHQCSEPVQQPVCVPQPSTLNAQSFPCNTGGFLLPAHRGDRHNASQFIVANDESGEEAIPTSSPG
jgi:hypothetical protein